MPHPYQAPWQCTRCLLKGAIELESLQVSEKVIRGRMMDEHRRMIEERNGTAYCPNNICVARVAELRT